MKDSVKEELRGYLNDCVLTCAAEYTIKDLDDVKWIPSIMWDFISYVHYNNVTDDFIEVFEDVLNMKHIAKTRCKKLSNKMRNYLKLKYL